jgi:hypothetical protein
VLSRLTKLEEMVKGLADGSQSGQDGSSAAKGGAGTNGDGHGLPPDDNTVYHGPTSWAALVESIHNIQSALEAEDNVEEDFIGASPEQVQDVVFGDLTPVTVEDMLGCLPPRQVTDKLVAAYFESKFVAVLFIHTHHFRRRYDAFWESPASSNILWVSILFSVVSVGATIAQIKEIPLPSPGIISAPQTYMAMAARCLVAGKYLQAKAFSVEALLAHAHSRNIRGKDSDSELWSIYGVAVRVAQRRGYHRDPEAASLELSPFDAEMRRRIWCMIQSYDLLFSFQQGMPPMIHESDCDVALPTNLTDDDFDEDTAELPPPRSTADPNPAMPYIYKGQFLPILRRIICRALGVKVPSYPQVLEIASDMDAWHDAIPPCMKFRSIRESAFGDSNHTIMHRTMLELVYQTARCILYCPFLNPTRGKCNELSQSMAVCRDAATRIMHIHLEVDRETKRGGRMYEDRYMITSLALTDFLNAAMILCVDITSTEEHDEYVLHLRKCLYYSIDRPEFADRIPSQEGREMRINLLRDAYQSYVERSFESQDAAFATKVLRAILKRVGSPSSASSGNQSLPLGHTPVHMMLSQQRNGEHAAKGSTVLMQDPLDGVQHLNFDELPPLDGIFNNSEPFDWVSLSLLSLFAMLRPRP